MYYLPSVQRTYAQFVAERRSEDLFASFDTDTEDGRRNLARLRSCACRASSIWMDTLPLSMRLQLTDSDFIGAMRHRLGLTHMPANAPGIRCCCGQYMRAGDVDHAMTCRSQCTAMTLRHNILTEIWRRIASRAGIASSVEPTLRVLPGVQAAPIAAHSAARGDILLVLPGGLTVADISVVHPCAPSFVQLAQTEGGAAAARDQLKRTKYQSADPNGYAFSPLSHETFGRMGKPAMELLNTLATTASAGGDVIKDGFVTNALRELSIGLCRGNAIMYRRSLQVLARASGRAFMTGLPVPTADVQ